MDCRKCMHHGFLAGDAHISCRHPEVSSGAGMLLAYFGVLKSTPLPLNVQLNEYGLQQGWANWPFEFDPIWIEKCDGFKPKGAE